jgi:hypothetical protein
VVLLCPSSSARADELLQKYRQPVAKGLEWLASKQHDDGSYSALPNQSTYPIAMTSLAGMAFLMEGSTLREGKYSAQLRKAADHLMEKSQIGGNRDGLLGDPSIQSESVNYMHGHGFALLFLSCVYGDEPDKTKRAKLKDILERAVKYSVAAQSSRGGWFYKSKAESGDQDEGSVTVTQVQALRAAAMAKIGESESKPAIEKAYKYLKDCTGPGGGIHYSWQVKQEKAPITAAGVTCLFSAGQYQDALAKQWLGYCKTHIPHKLNSAWQEEYMHYYYAQCLYVLGDEGWAKLFNVSKDQSVTWTDYRDSICDQLVAMQNSDGSWPGKSSGNIGQFYATVMWLAVMQLDKGVLPIYQR